MRSGLLAAIAAMTVACPFEVVAVPAVFSAGGPTAGDIQPAVDAFRAALGTLNPNEPVNAAGGRREINWDAVPDAFADPNPFPGDFFNANVSGRARGIEFTTPGSGFQLSSTAASGEPVQFGFPTQFEPFSPERLFTPVGSNFTDVFFFDPANPSQAATSTGFGIVFSDVEQLASTRMAFFGEDGTLLLPEQVVPVAGNEGFSFLGVTFDEAVLARVLIVSGSAIFDGTSFTTGDEVVMDDFIFGEPTPRVIPLPATLPMLAAAALCLAVLRRRHPRPAAV